MDVRDGHAGRSLKHRRQQLITATHNLQRKFIINEEVIKLSHVSAEVSLTSEAVGVGLTLTDTFCFSVNKSFRFSLPVWIFLSVVLTCGSLASMLAVKRCRQSVCSGSTAQTSGPADSRKTVSTVSRLTRSTAPSAETHHQSEDAM